MIGGPCEPMFRGLAVQACCAATLYPNSCSASTIRRESDATAATLPLPSSTTTRKSDGRTKRDMMCLHCLCAPTMIRLPACPFNFASDRFRQLPLSRTFAIYPIRPSVSREPGLFVDSSVRHERGPKCRILKLTAELISNIWKGKENAEQIVK